MSNLNLNYLEKRILSRPQSVAALRNFYKWPSKKLLHILRHHNDTDDGISEAETWLRDEFDYLLSFYSILEIAMMIGFVKEAPPLFIEKHLPVLCDRAVRQYYDWNYPLDLPRRLRERLQSDVSYSVTNTQELNAALYDFIELTILIETDDDLESFLWCLDDGKRLMGKQSCDIELVQAALKKPARFARAIQKPVEDRDELDRALNGFCKFIQFCESLTLLLERVKAQPQVAEAMWLSNAYWLRKAGSELGSGLDSAMQSLVKWKVPAGGRRVIHSRVSELTTKFHALAIPPLTNWKLGRPVQIREVHGEQSSSKPVNLSARRWRSRPALP